MTIAEMLVGKRVKMAMDCEPNNHIGEIYTLEIRDKDLWAGDCTHVGKWELLEPINFKPAPHKHALRCSTCGEEIKPPRK